MQMGKTTAIALTLVFAGTTPALAQRADPAMIAAEQAAMDKLAWMDGTWRGPATTRAGTTDHAVTQTERIGPMLGGTIRVLEGKGYNADGSIGFNAFATISFNPASTAYTLHSNADGRVGDFKLVPTEDGKQQGYFWEIPAGPMTIRYTATYDGTVWREVGDQIVPGQPPRRFFEMVLKRVGTTDWPSAGALPPK